jgi:uncharacterized protein YihD (DUF1040 family)
MEQTHNEIFESLQTEYLKNRDSKILGKMYCVAKEAAYNYLKKYCKQRGLFHLDIEEKSHDAALFVIEQYLKKSEFKVLKISAYIYFGVKKVLFKDKDKEQKEISYEQYFEEHKDKYE